MRPGGVMRKKAFLLRAERKRPNSSCLCKEAGERRDCREDLGPPPLVVSLGAPAELSLGLELDSCAKPFAAANSNVQPTRMLRLRILGFNAFTSILCRAQYRRQVLRKARARQNFIPSPRLRLSTELGLHVRQQTDHANVLARLPQLFNRLERLAPRVQVHDDEFWLTQHQSLQRLAACRYLHLHPKL